MWESLYNDNMVIVCVGIQHRMLPGHNTSPDIMLLARDRMPPVVGQDVFRNQQQQLKVENSEHIVSNKLIYLPYREEACYILSSSSQYNCTATVLTRRRHADAND